jgi:ArsR family transcriptional regulator
MSHMSDSGGFPLLQTADCVSEFAAPPMRLEDARYVAPLLQVLSDPVRLRLVSIVSASVGRQACVCDLDQGWDLTDDELEEHLDALVDSGLLARVVEGVWVYYRLEPGVLSGLVNLTATLTR